MSIVKVKGVGHYCPEKIVKNDELALIVDTSDEWIVKRTGIKSRRISTGEGTVDLAVNAAKKALENSECTPKDIDLIIVATTSPDRLMPSTACSVQSVLECTNATAFDVSAACSGFVYSAIIANSLLKSGERTRALIIGTEVLSRIVNWEDRNTCVLFGDGAGAAVLEVSNESGGIISTCFGSDGKSGSVLTSTELPINTPFSYKESDDKKYIEMDGRLVFTFAISIIPKVVNELLEKSKEDLSDIKYIIPHQANTRIIEEAAKRLKIDKEKFYVNLDSYGNTSAASIPIALSELMEKKLVKKGDKVLLVAFGGGLTWAGIILEI